MKIGQKITKDGCEILGFPMEYLTISQGCNGQLSHMGSYALDICGKDGGIDQTIAPCSMRFIYHDIPEFANTVFFESTGPVWFADGTKDYATFCFAHDNYVGDIDSWASQGKIWKQGETFGDEGTAGYATGNHCHMEVAKGKFTGTYYLKNKYGVYTLPNQISPDKAFVIDGTILVNNGQPLDGSNEMYWKKSTDVKIEDKWIKDSKGWWYRYKDGSYPKSEWKELYENQGLSSNPGKKQWYYFNALGYMVTNKWKESKEKWYYLGPNGAMYTNCVKNINGKWYHFEEDGAMTVNKRIPIEVYFDEDGVMHE